MNPPTYSLERGTKVKTHGVLESTDGLDFPGMIPARRTDSQGIILTPAGGQRGDVYFIAHNYGSPEQVIAPYSYTEFEVMDEMELTDKIEDADAELKITNACISETRLGYGLDGCLTFELFAAPCERIFGGWRLDPCCRPSILTGAYISAILHIAEVTHWEDLKGKYVRIARRKGKIVAIGHILKDSWFAPKILIECMTPALDWEEVHHPAPNSRNYLLPESELAPALQAAYERSPQD
jgi:hypothetical protein